MSSAEKDKDGRPLKDRRARNYGTQPFKGQEGKPHKRLPHLQARQAEFDALPANRQHGRKKPGSLKK